MAMILIKVVGRINQLHVYVLDQYRWQWCSPNVPTEICSANLMVGRKSMVSSELFETPQSGPNKEMGVGR